MPTSDCKIKIDLPIWLKTEITRVYKDLKHASKGELEKISLDSQIYIAKKMKEIAENKGSTLTIPTKQLFEITNLPSSPNLKLYLHFKSTGDMLKAKADGVGLMYELYHW